MNNKKKFIFKALVLCLSILYISCITIPGLLRGYSFWTDELFTVAFIDGSWADLFTDWIAPDTHPPLYFIGLKIWSGIYGKSEISLRSMSFIFAVMTVILLWIDWMQTMRVNRLFTLLLVISNPMFAFYAQEARSYEVVLFFSCLTIILTSHLKESILKNEPHAKILSLRSLIYISCLILSLVHYFGFILAIAILTIDLFKRIISKSIISTFSWMALLAIWPSVHVALLGNFGDVQRARLSFLAEKSTSLESISNAYMYSNYTFMFNGLKAPEIIVQLIVATITIISLWKILANYIDKKNMNEIMRDYLYCFWILATTLVLIILINSVVPMITHRNFIILLYPSSLMLSSCIALVLEEETINIQWRRVKYIATISIFTLIILLSTKMSQINTTYKSWHAVDYKSLAEYVKSSNICEDGCYITDYDPSDKESFGGQKLNYYFDDVKLTKYEKESLEQMLPIIGSDLSAISQTELQELEKNFSLITTCNGKKNQGNVNSFILMPRVDESRNQNANTCIPKN